MDQNFQTSFIPKKPIINKRATQSQPIGFLVVVAMLILFTVLLATGALFFYKGVLAKNIIKMENNLTLARNRFEPSKITELQTLDKRLRASSEILSQHIAVTPVFQALADLTMKTVRYTDFTYRLTEEDNTTPSRVIINLSGQAIGYRSIALQSDLFAQNKNLINPVFSNLTLDNSGNVLFDLEFSVDPSFVNYQRMLEAAS
ncbi:MAG: hypothetical protein WD963_00340 [Candidatus Paceibacterota bacterium]